jgi:peptide/nickel transport system substrate-binding protein
MRVRAQHPFAAILLAALVLGGCRVGDQGGVFDDVPREERYGGTVVVGGIGALQSLNPLAASDNNSNNIMRDLLLMPLVKYDENIELIPWLAERWDTVRVAPDSLELTWHLRRDVRWHDGTPTTGRDVVFTFEAITNPEYAFPNLQRLARYRPTAELVDDYTVRMRLQPHADFLDIFVMTPIAPAHLLADVPAGQMIQHPFQHEPTGNGPFRFTRRVPGQEWVFDANPDFPEALGGRPFVDRIVYRSIPEMTTLMTEILTGRVDMYLGPNPNQADQLRNADGVELRADRSLQWNYLAFNGRLPIFQDPRTRRAIGMAIDRQQVVDALVYGYGEVGRASVTPGHWAYDSEATLPHDPEGARRLLAEAGWTPGPDGVLRNAQGQQLRFTLITNAGNDVRRDITEVIQAQLRPLGIVVQPRLVEWTSMIQMLQGSLGAGGQRQRNFEAVIGGWVDFQQKDDAGILHSRNLNQPYQYVGYSNPRADALIDTLAVIVSREEARPLWLEYQRLISHDAPYIPLYYPERLTAVRTRLRDVVTDTRGEFVSARLWWIHPQQRRAGGVPAAQPEAGTDTTP